MTNAATAWLYGCARQTRLFSVWGADGQPSLEGLIIEYIGLRGDAHGIDTTTITEIAAILKGRSASGYRRISRLWERIST